MKNVSSEELVRFIDASHKRISLDYSKINWNHIFENLDKNQCFLGKENFIIIFSIIGCTEAIDVILSKNLASPDTLSSNL